MKCLITLHTHTKQNPHLTSVFMALTEYLLLCDCRTFTSCFKLQSYPPPPTLLEYLFNLQDQVLDWRAFEVASSFYTYAAQGGGGFWNSGEKALVGIFLQEASIRALNAAWEMAQWWTRTHSDLQVQLREIRIPVYLTSFRPILWSRCIPMYTVQKLSTSCGLLI